MDHRWHPEGTRILADLRPGESGSFPEQFTPLTDESFVFVADAASDGYPSELWSSDGTAASLVIDVEFNPVTGTDQIRALITFEGKGKVIFSAFNQAATWVSDGMAAGTQQIAPMQAGSFTQAGDVMFFAANDGVHGVEWWVTDGTPDGTRLFRRARRGVSRSGSPRAIQLCQLLDWLVGR